jgi:hypothetical protein
VDRAKILVVANPYEATRIAAWLEGGGLPLGGPVRVGDGSDETVAEFAADPADLVVLVAQLAAGDSLALAAALRSEGPRHLKIVLIGDEQGPVRTALDAVDYAADRFLRRPLAEKALVFAVRSCLEPQARPPRMATKMGIVPRPSSAAEQSGAVVGGASGAPRVASTPEVAGGLAGGLASAMVAPGASARATQILRTLSRAPSEPPVFDASDIAEEVPDDTPDVARVVAAQSVGATSALIARLDEVTASMLDEFLHDAVSRTVDAAVGADLSTAVEYTAEPGDPVREMMEPQITSDFTPAPSQVGPAPELPPSTADAADPPPPEAPPWREPTLILSGGSSPSAPSAQSTPAPVHAPVAPHDHVTPTPSQLESTRDGDEVDDTSPLAPAAPPAGAIARALRRTMSAIEKRLFGDESSDESAEPQDQDEADAEIDLDKIAGTTSPGFIYGLGGGELGRVDEAGTAPSPPPEVPLASNTGVFDPDAEGGLPRAASVPPVAVSGQLVDLAAEDTAALLARLHDEGFTGKLVFARDDVQKLVFLDVGRPVFANSNLPHDRMGDLLYREGKITREQFARSREIVAGTGRRMGEILVEMGFLKRRELLPAVRRHVEDIIYSLFAWDSGTVTLAQGDAAQDERIRLATHPTALLFEGIRRKMDLPRLRARVGGDETVIVPLKRDDIASALAEADLATEERAAADLFDGRRTLAEVVGMSRIDATSVWQLAHALCALGLARAVEKGREQTEAARAQVVRDASTQAGAGDVAIDRERVLAKHSHVLEADYFQVLGVRRDASAFEIKRAWEAARRDYAPEAFPAEVQRDLGDALREIAAIVDEAFRVLRDGAVRTQYLENLKE